MEAKEKLKIVKNTLIGIILVLCLTGFVWICYDQVVKYIKKFTVTNTEYEIDDLPFPNILFCSSKAFKGKFNKTTITKDEYDQKSIEVGIEFHGFVDDEIGPPKMVEHTR